MREERNIPYKKCKRSDFSKFHSFYVQKIDWLTRKSWKVLAGVKAQRIYPVGKAWLIKNKVVPLHHEPYPIASSHPSGCADRQL